MPGILTVVAGLTIVVAGLLVVLEQARDDVPAPFESTGMYEMAEHLFDPDDCFQVRSEDEAPLVWNLEPRPDDLVRCTLPDESYTAIFMCNDSGDVEYLHAAYLENAIPDTVNEVESPPAGWDATVDGVQLSFQHDFNPGARVYWDSPERGCAAELQSDSTDVSAIVDYWETGQP
jgi:hypothetical protein